MKQKPVILLADSQNLFWQKNGQAFLESILEGNLPLRAAYVGASNDDKPEFFMIFKAAMEQIKAKEILHIQKDFSSAEKEYLEKSDLILLAGGDVELGWNTISKTGMAEIIVNRYYNGSYLIGVSAGAVHLGLMALSAQGELFETLKCVPFIIDVHQEERGWERLKKTLSKVKNPFVHGLGIPMGSGIVYHTDHTIEAVRKPAWLFEQTDNGLKSQLLLPKDFKETSQRSY